MKILLSPDAPDPGAASSGTGEELFTGGQGAEGTQEGASGAEAATGDASGGAEPAAATPAATTGLSKDDVQQILTGALAQVGQRVAPAAAPAERQYTQEEFDKAFNVLKLSPEFIAQLRNENPEIALKALEQYRDGLVRQAMTMAEYRVQALLKEIRDNELAPIQTFVSEQQATSFRTDFFKSNPDLEKYEQLVDSVAAKLAQNGVRGTRAEMMGHYATETKKVIAELTAAQGNANGNGNGKGAVGGQASTTRSKMSTLTGGGHTVAGKPSSGKHNTGNPNVDAGLAVFD